MSDSLDQRLRGHSIDARRSRIYLQNRRLSLSLPFAAVLTVLTFRSDETPLARCPVLQGYFLKRLSRY